MLRTFFLSYTLPLLDQFQMLCSERRIASMNFIIIRSSSVPNNLPSSCSFFPVTRFGLINLCWVCRKFWSLQTTSAQAKWVFWWPPGLSIWIHLLRARKLWSFVYAYKLSIFASPRVIHSVEQHLWLWHFSTDQFFFPFSCTPILCLLSTLFSGAL